MCSFFNDTASVFSLSGGALEHWQDRQGFLPCAGRLFRTAQRRTNRRETHYWGEWAPWLVIADWTVDSVGCSSGCSSIGRHFFACFSMKPSQFELAKRCRVSEADLLMMNSGVLHMYFLLFGMAILKAPFIWFLSLPWEIHEHSCRVFCKHCMLLLFSPLSIHSCSGGSSYMLLL